ncbi:VWA domain-containing protein [Opitutus sp. ER46]|uniref:vWA domain-containing protein n=1 Tax=Opitutus sp. ER46 TaxID=2161864 RepID=UPI000D3010E6|nr:VWA domain-containing protein [Opitutus sp. ER46]PTX96463.1 VWA domain-containing protein [Opitutus sp. ER46]
MKLRSFLSCLAWLGCAFVVLNAQLAAAPADVGATVRLRVDVDREVMPAGRTDKAIIKVALDGLRLPRRDARPPINLALVIDRSGSMSGEKIENARQAALEAVRRLGADDIVALIAYDTQVETIVPARRVGDGRLLERAIRSLEASGNTALYGGVTCGATEVRRHLEDEGRVSRIILLSDGLANVGPSSPQQLGRLGASLMSEGISVTTVGLGLGFNEDLMTRLAQRSDGNTYFVENSEDLPRIFAAELGDVLSVVARRVVIEIEFPKHVRPVGFIGREGTIRGQRAELTLNQIYGGQEKFALVEVEVAPTAAGEEQELARASVRYDDPVNRRQESLSAHRSVRFSARDTDVIGSANHKVQADYAANVLAVAKDEVVALVDANQRKEAGSLLARRAAELDQLAKTYRNTAVSSLAAPAAAEARRVDSDGLDAAARKTYRADNAQIRAQQNAGRQ